MDDHDFDDYTSHHYDYDFEEIERRLPALEQNWVADQEMDVWSLSLLTTI